MAIRRFIFGHMSSFRDYEAILRPLSPLQPLKCATISIVPVTRGDPWIFESVIGLRIDGISSIGHQ